MLVNVSKMPTRPESTVADVVVPQLCVKKGSPHITGEKKKRKKKLIVQHIKR